MSIKKIFILFKRSMKGYDEDKVIVPTLECLRVGRIPSAFRVQHSSDLVTHKMEWKEDKLGRNYPYSYLLLRSLKALYPVVEIIIYLN